MWDAAMGRRKGSRLFSFYLSSAAAVTVVTASALAAALAIALAAAEAAAGQSLETIKKAG